MDPRGPRVQGGPRPDGPQRAHHQLRSDDAVRDRGGARAHYPAHIPPYLRASHPCISPYLTVSHRISQGLDAEEVANFEKLSRKKLDDLPGGGVRDGAGFVLSF